MTTTYNHTDCNCPVCTLVANNVTIMHACITIYKEDDETGLSVPDYPRYTAFQHNEVVSDALREIALDFHYTHALVVNESKFCTGPRHELFITRTKRNVYTLFFHTKPVETACDACGHSREYWEAQDDDVVDPCWKCVMCAICGDGPASTGVVCTSKECADERAS